MQRVLAPLPREIVVITAVFGSGRRRCGNGCSRRRRRAAPALHTRRSCGDLRARGRRRRDVTRRRCGSRSRSWRDRRGGRRCRRYRGLCRRWRRWWRRRRRFSAGLCKRQRARGERCQDNDGCKTNPDHRFLVPCVCPALKALEPQNTRSLLASFPKMPVTFRASSRARVSSARGLRPRLRLAGSRILTSGTASITLGSEAPCPLR